MKGFPKTIGTGQDLLNLLALVQAKELSADDLRAAIVEIEARTYITCPIVAISDDRKTVTINYCSEAGNKQTVNGGVTISSVTHQNGENAQDQTVIKLAAALGADETALQIPAPSSPLDALGITQDQLNNIKGVLNQL